MIPLFNGMVISFINYELHVRIEPKSSEELAASKHAEYPSLFKRTAAPSAPVSVKQSVVEPPASIPQSLKANAIEQAPAKDKSFGKTTPAKAESVLIAPPSHRDEEQKEDGAKVV
jgi:hypothetical protein